MATYNLPNYERQTEILNKATAIKTTLDAGTIGKTPHRQIFTSNGTWKAPAGVARVFVTGGGGGGGGAVYVGASLTAASGGVTSFGNLLSLPGGGGGTSGANANLAMGGVAGGPGGAPGTVLIPGSSGSSYGGGGSAGFFKGGTSTLYNPPADFKNGGYCSGGGSTAGNGGAGAGGSGDFVINYPLTVTPNARYDITIGSGGQGAVGSNGSVGGNGGNGILIIEWWE